MRVFIASVSIFLFLLCACCTHSSTAPENVRLFEHARAYLSMTLWTLYRKDCTCVCVCTCVWCKTLTISARRGFPPGPHPVHCHSQSSNLWGQRLFCHRLSFTVAHELPLLPLNRFSEITKSKDNSVLHIFSFVISVRLEHVVFLFVASQYGHFLKEPFRHGRHHVAGSLNWFKWWHLLLFRKVLYYLNICYSSILVQYLL